MVHLAYLRFTMRLPITCLILVLSSILTGCTSVDMPKGNSKGYASARLIKDDARPLPQFAQIDADVNGMIQESIGALVRKNGLAFIPADGEADIVVTYLLIMQNSIGTTAIDDYFGYGRDVESITAAAHEKWVVKGNSEDDLEVGTLVVDVLESSTRKLVYRGFSHGNIEREISDEERSGRIAGAVEEALQSFFR